MTLTAFDELLRELRFKAALLESQSEASLDGIIVVSPAGEVISLNRRFIELWEIPEELVRSRSLDGIREVVRSQVVDREEHAARVQYLYEHPHEMSRDQISLKDGRVFDRYSAPVLDPEGDYYGRVWFYRNVTEQHTDRQRASIQYAVAQTLAQAISMDEAMPRILPVVCEGLELDWGALWTMEAGKRLRCSTSWRRSPSLTNLEKVSREATFAPGSGLPGQVWVTREAAWVLNLRRERNFPRAGEMQRGGLQSALAFPILVEGVATGVLEFATERRLERDERLLAVLTAMGSQIGQFIRRRQVEEAGRDRMAFLAGAGTALAASLDLETTLQSLVELIVPTLADWCIVDLVRDGSLQQVAVAHADPTKVELARTLRHRYPPDRAHPIWETLTSGQSDLAMFISEADLMERAHDQEHLRLLREVGIVSHMVVPLVARDRTLGAISFVAGQSGRHYLPEDLELAEDLARRAALAVDNARLYEEAREAVRGRDEFLSMISHDLKNPLGAIKGFAQLSRRRAAQAGSLSLEQILDGLEKIDVTATRMSGLINELLDLARMPMDEEIRLELEPVDLVALVRRVVADNRQTSRRHRIRMRADMPHLVGEWDAARLERVLANLLANAIKYSPRGGRISIKVGAEKEASGAWAVIEVRDQGIGIPAADLPFIFDRFRRGSNVAGRIRGTGIGLASAKHIVEQHGGAILVSSREGEGSRFTVRLPLAPAALAVDPAPEVVPSDGG